MVSVPFHKQADVVDLKALKDRVKAFTKFISGCIKIFEVFGRPTSFNADDWSDWCVVGFTGAGV